MSKFEVREMDIQKIVDDKNTISMLIITIKNMCYSKIM